MSETEETAVLKQKRKRLRVRGTDILVFVVIIAAIAILSTVLVSKLTLKRHVEAAQAVSDKAIAALQKRDGNAALALGTPTFKKTYTAQQLTQQFKAVEVATSQAPKLDTQTVYNGKDGQTIYFIYKYTRLKVPYYVRTAIADKSGNWQLTNISGNIDESKLVIVQ